MTESASGYCIEHEKIIQSQLSKKYNYQYNHFKRSPETSKHYGRQWRKTRAAFLSINPLCEMCKRKGRYTLATEVHHIKAVVDGGTDEFENLMALCKSCHSKITYEENFRGRSFDNKNG